MSDNTIHDNTIDFDAILAKREEEVGSRDKFPFVFGGKTWWVVDPTLADDDWRDELQELGLDEDGDEDIDPVEIAEHYLGADQWEQFVAAGGRSAYVLQALKIHVERQTDTDAEGRPTQRSRSSRAIRRRSKRR